MNQRKYDIGYDDPIVNEVRKTREPLAKKFDYDVGAIFRDLRKQQAKLGSRLVRRGRKKAGKRTPTPKR